MMRRAGVCAAAALLAAAAGSAYGFETNGKKWPQMPVQYWVNPEACPILEDGTTILDLMEQATTQWTSVSCTSAAFQFMGTTTAMWDADGMNTVFCADGKNMEWSFGKDAGGATLWLPTGQGQPMEVDLALNAYDLEWVEGGGDAMTGGKVDPAGLITHELGHWLGLTHSPDPYATMYYASLPFGFQATLDADDKAGICTVYPGGESECTMSANCPEDHDCVTIGDWQVCKEVHDGPGTECSKDWINCEGICWVSFYECTQICLFTVADFSAGYCAPLCEQSPECPDGFGCVHVVQPGVDVHICQIGAPPPEAEEVEAVELPVEGFVEVVETVEAADLEAPDAGVVADAAAEPALDVPVEPDVPAVAEVVAEGVVEKDGSGGSGGGCGVAPVCGFSWLALAAGLLVLRAARRAGQRGRADDVGSK